MWKQEDTELYQQKRTEIPVRVVWEQEDTKLY